MSKMHKVFDKDGKNIGTIFAENEEKALADAKKRNPAAAQVGSFSHDKPVALDVNGKSDDKGAKKKEKDDKETKS